jgi:tetratricopeptide (TPR) repeat protein
MAAWLYRPLLDLGETTAPFNLATSPVEFAWRRLAHDAELPGLTGFHSGALRAEVVRAIRRPEYDVADPRLLPDELRSERWGHLCDQVDRWHDLPALKQLHVIELVERLGFFPLALELLENRHPEDESGYEFDFRLARVIGRYLLWSDDHSSPYSLSEFAEIADHAPAGLAKLTACYQMVRQPARESADKEACEAWQPRHLEAIEELRDDLSEFDYLRYLSRYHRVGAFIPQISREAEGTIAEMERAESLARSLPRDTWDRRIAAEEILYAALESRSKEALWLGDGERALAHARELVDLQPAFSRTWFHQGDMLFRLDRIAEARDAYRQALRYSPPGAARALYSIGQCEEILGDAEAAADCYVAALDHDPLGVGAANALAELSHRATPDPCRDYAEHALRQLELLGAPSADRAGMGTAHQRVPPPVSAVAR